MKIVADLHALHSSNGCKVQPVHVDGVRKDASLSEGSFGVDPDVPMSFLLSLQPMTRLVLRPRGCALPPTTAYTACATQCTDISMNWFANPPP